MEWDTSFYMKNKKKTSIQAKTLFFLLSYNVVIIILLWFCQIKILDIYYEKEQILNMNNIVYSLKSVESDNLISTLQEIAYEKNVCIFCQSPDTEVLFGCCTLCYFSIDFNCFYSFFERIYNIFFF